MRNYEWAGGRYMPPQKGTLSPCSKAGMGIHTGQVFPFSREARNLNFYVKSDLYVLAIYSS